MLSEITLCLQVYLGFFCQYHGLLDSQLCILWITRFLCELRDGY